MRIQQMISRFPLCLLVWCTLAVAPTCAQTITHVPLFTFDGDSADDSFGYSVSGAGDVNGDGFADLIVGATGDDNNETDSGSARVLSGVDGSVLHNFDGDSADGGFGVSVSGANDVNGDGFADLIVGAIYSDTNGIDSGKARVYSGADGSALYDFDGDSAGDLFGWSVSGAGDVNGDGFADLIVGAPEDDNFGRSSGSARVLSGSDGSVLYNFDGDTADGFSFGDLFGLSVSGAGDVNGDGFADLIVGSPFDSNNGIHSGSARVFSGADGSVLYNFDGETSDGFGYSVSGAGDVNGDGFDDLIVGAIYAENDGQQNGSARVLSGSDGSVLFSVGGDSANDRFGYSVSGAGDVNGDGFDDLIVGAFRDDNQGGSSGSARVFSGSDGSVLYTFDGDSADDSLGWSVSGAGDVNGDGLADFIVSARYGGANDGGYARLYVSQTTDTIILGDCDLNGVVDFLDISPFVETLTSNTYLQQADCNQDGVVNFLDIFSLIAILNDR